MHQGAGHDRSVDPIVVNLIVFVLAIFVGFRGMERRMLKGTLLMSLTNAISSIIMVGAMPAAGADLDQSGWLGVVGVMLVSINTFGGFLVTWRMLEMSGKRSRSPAPRKRTDERQSTRTLASGRGGELHPRAKGLSGPHTARRGNLYGMIGMGIALLVTLALVYSHSKNVLPILVAMVIGAAVERSCPTSADDRCRAGRGDALARRSRGVFIAIAAVNNPSGDGTRRTDHLWPQARVIHRHVHRRHHVFGVRDRVRQAVRACSAPVQFKASIWSTSRSASR